MVSFFCHEVVRDETGGMSARKNRKNGQISPAKPGVKVGHNSPERQTFLKIPPMLPRHHSYYGFASPVIE
jgi:hypothetical protein